MRLVVGISGASGAVYGIRLLEVLRSVPDVETHVVISPAASRTIALETDYGAEAVESLGDVGYAYDDISAPICSGSFKTIGMAVIPCSMKSLSGIATSFSENLILRAADVTLKERRRLILVCRETPLHLGHLRLMARVTEMGAIVMPPVPALYSRPKTLQNIVDQTVQHVLDLLGVELPRDLSPRWLGPERE